MFVTQLILDHLFLVVSLCLTKRPRRFPVRSHKMIGMIAELSLRQVDGYSKIASFVSTDCCKTIGSHMLCLWFGSWRDVVRWRSMVGLATAI